jgi:uncharacterized protein (DUF736 family)
MTTIGEFTSKRINYRAGYIGRIRTPGYDGDVTIVLKPDVPDESDYRIHAGNADGPLIGEGWMCHSKETGFFVAIELKGPRFPQTIHADLRQVGSDTKAWSLHPTPPHQHRGQD